MPWGVKSCSTAKLERAKNIAYVAGRAAFLRQGLQQNRGALRQIFPATSLIQTAVVYTGARDKSCNRGPATSLRQRFVTGEGPRQTGVSGPPICVSVFMFTFVLDFMCLFVIIFNFCR